MKPPVITEYGSYLKVRAGKLVLFDQDTKTSQEWEPGAIQFDAVICETLGVLSPFRP